MAYRFTRNRPLGDEVRRLYLQQLAAAIRCLTDSADAHHAVHQSRKHIKKARALLDAIAADAPVAGARWELTIANRALGTVGDAHRVIPIVAELRGYDRERAPDAALDGLHAALVARAELLEQRAGGSAERDKVVRLLGSARAQAESWNLRRMAPSTIIAALATAHRRARRSRRKAIDHPGAKSYHRWRKRTKAEWYLFRLVVDHTGGRLLHDQHRLAALDACLGQLHDVQVLSAIVASEPLLDRRTAARLLMVLRQLARDLRRRAGILSVVLNDRRRDVKRRVTAVWGMPARPSSVESSCRPAA